MLVSPDICNQINAVPEITISYVDDAVLKGASRWARTAKIETISAQGELVDYFIKVRQGEGGKNVLSAEFTSMTALYNVMPEMVARPVGWGEFETLEDIWFLVMQFYQLSGDVPDPSPFAQLVADMHKKGVAPHGEFGVPWDVYGANAQCQPYKPADTWEECFRFALKETFGFEIATQGPDEETQRILLRPLEEDGRTVVPRLCHGDLWDGNVSVDVNTGRPIIFDAIPLYAHNEFELCTMKVPYHKMQHAYIDEYVKHFGKSEPSEEFDDRLWLYYFLGPQILQFASHSCMRHLIEKYGEGYEGYLARKS
ncbi:hypothetical protein E8E14_009635 [Neopestalotiopsis sp. 37M]|nr:hypothetical protein E8E14_009635 [Neopestalotiopsis sp. 37M]